MSVPQRVHEMIRARPVRRAATRLRRVKDLSIVIASLSLIALASPVISSAADNTRTYPEKGRVIDATVSEHTEYVPVSPPDSKGRSGGGEALITKTWVYRVETDDGTYEFEGGKRQNLKTGDDVEFRVEKDSVHVRAGAKDVKYRLVSTTPRSVK